MCRANPEVLRDHQEATLADAVLEVPGDLAPQGVDGSCPSWHVATARLVPDAAGFRAAFHAGATHSVRRAGWSEIRAALRIVDQLQVPGEHRHLIEIMPRLREGSVGGRAVASPQCVASISPGPTPLARVKPG